MSLSPIRKLLIANRGEIAVRIIRTCHERGIVPVAVYSDADASALHVRMATEAYHIGAAASSESYLRAETLLSVARTAGVDAVHPGYGFLSENADFAQRCSEEGVIFVGPPVDAIRTMGDKTAARALMSAAGVAMAPGTPEAVSDVASATNAAENIGFPVLIKAAAGGGGKGMRVIERTEDFAAGLRQAQNEARNAFGDDRVYVEKYLYQPRHVEIQILADTHGNVVHLYERECSIQRRHQKVIEEAPSSVLSPIQRNAMGQAAISAARACNYVGAGTVEFLLDADGEFYFLEMNTRLQVEHPVTELITGLDLVAEQIRIAEGEPLGYDQDDIPLRGHAIECRVYAENPETGFLPNPGPLLRHRPPAGFGVRVDAGVAEGDTVPIHYDPMISKLATWGRTRAEAIERMDRALAEYEIAGVPTTIPFGRFVMQNQHFRSGIFSTSFIDEHYDSSHAASLTDEQSLSVALASTVCQEEKPRSESSSSFHASPNTSSAWARRRLFP